MLQIESAFLDLGHLDRLAGGDSPVHRLDPRAKLLTTLIFVAVVVSFDKYEMSALLPFFLFPVVLSTIGRLPVLFLAKRLLLVAPFAVLVGFFNPLLDRAIIYQLGPLGVSGGWVSFGSILLRFCLSVSAAFILIGTSGFYELCLALEKLRIPRAFAMQLLFLYRYIFVLVEEAIRLVRARALRSFGHKGAGLEATASLLGSLLLRTLQRARRIYLAMECRGFSGTFHLMKTFRFGMADALFVFGWSALFIVMRLVNVSQVIGNVMARFFS